jgi:hypothetical protein
MAKYMAHDFLEVRLNDNKAKTYQLEVSALVCGAFNMFEPTLSVSGYKDYMWCFFINTDRPINGWMPYHCRNIHRQIYPLELKTSYIGVDDIVKAIPASLVINHRYLYIGCLGRTL